MSEDFGNFKVSGFYLFEYKSSVWAQDGVRRITHTMEGGGNTAGQRGSHPPLKTDSHTDQRGKEKESTEQSD